MLTPESPLANFLTRIREKFGVNNKINLEIGDDQYGSLTKVGDFDRVHVFSFLDLSALCNFLNKD